MKIKRMLPPWAILRRDGKPRRRIQGGPWPAVRSCDGTPSIVDDSSCPNCNDCSLNCPAVPFRNAFFKEY